MAWGQILWTLPCPSRGGCWALSSSIRRVGPQDQRSGRGDLAPTVCRLGNCLVVIRIGYQSANQGRLVVIARGVIGVWLGQDWGRSVFPDKKPVLKLLEDNVEDGNNQ